MFCVIFGLFMGEGGLFFNCQDYDLAVLFLKLVYKVMWKDAVCRVVAPFCFRRYWLPKQRKQAHADVMRWRHALTCVSSVGSPATSERNRVGVLGSPFGSLEFKESLQGPFILWGRFLLSLMAMSQRNASYFLSLISNSLPGGPFQLERVFLPEKPPGEPGVMGAMDGHSVKELVGNWVRLHAVISVLVPQQRSSFSAAVQTVQLAWLRMFVLE